jgi:hypothetical protein
MPYDPLTGTDYDKAEARQAWGASMVRSAPAWSLRGEPGSFWWSYFAFKPYTGRVAIEADGFHWSTHSYDTGELLLSGVTTSVFEAFQSVTRNEVVTRDQATG